MNEKISALMDGELEAHEHDRCCARLARDEQALQTWRDYHLIGDALRDTSMLSAGFSERCRAKLADVFKGARCGMGYQRVEYSAARATPSGSTPSSSAT